MPRSEECYLDPPQLSDSRTTVEIVSFVRGSEKSSSPPTPIARASHVAPWAICRRHEWISVNPSSIVPVQTCVEARESRCASSVDRRGSCFFFWLAELSHYTATEPLLGSPQSLRVQYNGRESAVLTDDSYVMIGVGLACYTGRLRY